MEGGAGFPEGGPGRRLVSRRGCASRPTDREDVSMTGAEHQETTDTTGTTAPLRHAARGSLTREVILTAAIEFVDEFGLSALTMRALGRHLGVEAMALYRYVNGREDLLEGVVDRLVAELRVASAGQDLG